MSSVSNPTSSLYVRRKWLRTNARHNAVLPLKIDPITTIGSESIDSASTLVVATAAADLAISSPSSSVRVLIPSLSMFNLPATNPPLLSPPVLTASPASATPPPQFAIDYKQNKLAKLLTPRKRGLQKGYPSAFQTFLFDDTIPGQPITHGIRPVRLLIERLEAWHLLAKRLLHHFELLASVETRVSTCYRKLDRQLIFPTTSLKKRHKLIISKKKRRVLYKDQKLLQVHFNFQGGVKSVCDAWQIYHSNSAKDHSEFATFLRKEAIPTLANIKRELKWMIKSIKADDRLSLATLTSFKKEASKRLKELDRQLVFFDENPYYGHTKLDPWLMNAGVVKQMVKVYRQENKIHETVLRLQREALISEEQLIEEFRRLCQHIYHMRETSTLGLDHGLESIMKTFEQMDSDWTNFTQQNNHHLVAETAAFRHPDQLQYPNHSHPLLQPIFAARMERRSHVLHHWHEYIYVLTPAGFLHEYRDRTSYPAKPDTTIYVPHYKVSSLSTNLHHNLIFQLQPNAASRNLLKNQQGYHTTLPKEWRRSKSRLGCNDRLTWTLRAKSAADMDVWVQHLTECSERYRPTTVQFAPDIVISSASEVVDKDTSVEEGEEVAVVEGGASAEEALKVEEKVSGDDTASVAVIEAASPLEETPVEESSAVEEKPTVEVASTDAITAETTTPDSETAMPPTKEISPPETPVDNLVIE